MGTSRPAYPNVVPRFVAGSRVVPALPAIERRRSEEHRRFLEKARALQMWPSQRGPKECEHHARRFQSH